MTEIINRVAELRKDIETGKLIDVIEISVELIRIESLLKAINYTHCCKSDSELLFCSDCNVDLKEANGFCPKYIDCEESKTK